MQARPDDHMRIVLISDTHFAAHASAFMDNGRAVVRWIETTAPDLVIHLGDVTADGVKDPAHFDAAASVLGAISAPLRVLPGNHDVGEVPPHGGREEPALDLGRLDRFRALFGPDAWMHQQAGWALLGLNAQAFGHAEAEAAQWGWLDAALARASGRLGLFIHKPLSNTGIAPEDDHPRYAPPHARRALAARFAGRELAFVASGHTHQALQMDLDGVRRLWVPSCAFFIPDSIQPVIGDKVVGVMTLDLSDDTPRAEVVVPPGVRRNNLIDHADVYPKVATLPGFRESGV
jgi:3',5'-cyclic AMP phosphodiesterase CpdA